MREVDGETVVFDTTTQMVTLLDAETAAVWRASESEAPVEALAADLQLPQERVEVALVRLADAGLLKTHLTRRNVLRGAGAAAVTGALLTVMAPPALAASSTTRVISGSGTCGVGQGVGKNDVIVTVTGDGFSVGAVSYTITYPKSTGNGGTGTATGALNQSRTGTAGSNTVKLTNIAPGTTSVSISATDSTGNTTSGLVTLASC